MSTKTTHAALAAATALALTVPFASFAQTYHGDAPHPAYVHALSDLREARWDLQHRDGDTPSDSEAMAMTEVDRAIDEATRAAAADGKDLDSHPSPDVQLDYRGRLHNAENLLHKAQSDVNQDEDNPSMRDERDRVLMHIDAALQDTDRALNDADRTR